MCVPLLARFSDHIVQCIVYNLPYSVVLSLANKDSPHQNELLNAMYKKVALVQESDQTLKTLDPGTLKHLFLFEPKNADYIKISSLEIIDKLLELYPNIRIQQLEVNHDQINQLKVLPHMTGKIQRLVLRIGSRLYNNDLKTDTYIDVSKIIEEVPFDFIQKLSLLEIDLRGFEQSRGIALNAPNLSNLTDLHLYNVSADKLIDLPPNLKNLVLVEDDKDHVINEPISLTHLHFLVSVRIESIDFNERLEVLYLPTQLQRLSLRSVKLPRGFDTICELPNLTYLLLSGTIHEEVGDILSCNDIEEFELQLWFLDSTDRVLQTFPVQKNLKRMILGGRFESSLAHSFASLSSLTLSHTTLSSIPLFENLKYFQITHLAFERHSLSNSFKHLRKLNELVVNNCQLTMVDSHFPDSLEILDLSHNRLVKISGDLPLNLKRLNLNRNSISSLSVLQNKKLTELGLSWNKIRELSHNTLCLPENLSSLNLTGNDISVIDPSFSFPPSLFILQLHVNACISMNYVFNILPQLLVVLKLIAQKLNGGTGQRIEICFQHLWDVHLSGIGNYNFVWRNCPNLKYLKFEESVIPKIFVEDLPPTIRELDLRKNGIRDIEGDFKILPQLTKVDLGENHLQGWKELNPDKILPSVMLEEN